MHYSYLMWFGIKWGLPITIIGLAIWALDYWVPLGHVPPEPEPQSAESVEIDGYQYGFPYSGTYHDDGRREL